MVVPMASPPLGTRHGGSSSTSGYGVLSILRSPGAVFQAPSLLLQPSQRAVLHPAVSISDASAASAGESAIVERFVILVAPFRSKDLDVIQVFFEDLLVK